MGPDLSLGAELTTVVRLHEKTHLASGHGLSGLSALSALAPPPLAPPEDWALDVASENDRQLASYGPSVMDQRGGGGTWPR